MEYGEREREVGLDLHTWIVDYVTLSWQEGTLGRNNNVLVNWGTGRFTAEGRRQTAKCQIFYTHWVLKGNMVPETDSWVAKLKHNLIIFVK